jgi:hypothetical protein
MKLPDKTSLGKFLPAVIFGLGILTTVLSNKNGAIERETMKSELKDELLKELTSTEN